MARNDKKKHDTFKRLFSRYDLITLVLCAGLTLIEFFWIKDNGFGVISILLTFGFQFTISTIRFLITKDESEGRKKFKDIESSFGNIPPRWRDLAEKDLDICIHQLEAYNKKKFDIQDKEQLYSHQVSLIDSVKKSLKAVHRGEDYEKLKFWEPNQNGKFNATRIVKANANMKKGANKQRIFILSRKEFDENSEYRELLNTIVKHQKHTLKFRVKIIFIDDIDKQSIPYDFQIADGTEVFSVIFKSSDISGQREQSGQATIDEQEVKKKADEFEELWDNAKTPESIGINTKKDKSERKSSRRNK